METTKKEKIGTAAGFVGLVAFFVSAFFSLLGAIAFSSGAWVLYIVGIALIALSLRYSKGDGRSPKSAEFFNVVGGGMAGGMLFFGLFALLYWLGFGETSTSKSNNKSSMAHIQCQAFVKERLKAPSSADFAFLDYSASLIGENHYAITSTVEAQNSFGVKLKKQYFCSVKWNGQNEISKSNWTLVDLSIDE